MRAFRIRFEQGADGIVRGDFFQVDHGGLDEPLVDQSPVAMLGDVALGLGQPLQEFCFQLIPEEALGQLDGTAGVLDHLNGFDPGEFVKEPAATGVHQQGVALELKQLESAHFFLCIQFVAGVPGEEGINVFRSAVEDNFDVIIVGRPGVAQERPGAAFILRRQSVAKPVESVAQRSPPALGPLRMAARVATAMTPPALDSM